MADNRINIVISAKDQASGPLKEVSHEIDKTGDSSKRSSGLMDGFKGAVAGAAIALGAAAVAAGATATVLGFKFNSSVEQAEAKLMAFMKDGEKVAKTLEWVKKEAAETQFSFTDMADAAANLTPVAKTSGKSLEDLIKQAEILAALNPAEGLTGAVFSLREALSGDWVSIVDRFNLPRQRINELKEQGVPAMEIISRTLKEMGIDYGLVAAQGKTTAARFDQIKDKLVMLAGAAAKPIFDKVSEGLEEINKQDFTSIGKGLAGVSQSIIDVFTLLSTGDFKKPMFGGLLEEDSGVVDFLLSLREAWQTTWKIIEPAVQGLTKAIKEELLPAIDQMLGESGADSVQMFGYIVGGALWTLIKLLTVFVQAVAWWWSSVSTAVASVKQFFVEAPGAIIGAWNAVVDFFTHFPEHLAFAIGYVAGLIWRFATVDVPNAVNQVVGWFASLPVRVAIALINLWGETFRAFLNFRVNAVNWALDTVNAIVNMFLTLPGRITSALSGAMNGARNQVSDFINNVAKGLATGGKRNAIGTAYSSGGTTLVGEHGPELVNLPQGAQVTPAWQTRSQGGSAAQGPVVNISGTFNVRDDSDITRIAQTVIRLLDQSGQTAARGGAGI